MMQMSRGRSSHLPGDRRQERRGASGRWVVVLVVGGWLAAGGGGVVFGGEGQSVPADTSPGRGVAELRQSLELLDRGSAAYAERRKCFACHHQALPQAAHEAARRWRPRHTEREVALTEFTLESFRGRLDSLREGTGVGGRGLTAAYALWQLGLAGHSADEVTTALVEYLLRTQEEGGDWRLDAIRPPAEESRAMGVVLAGRGVSRYAIGEQRERAELCLARARVWLEGLTPTVHEDWVARAWGGSLPGMSREWGARARRELVSRQAPDGGWRPTPDFPTDAYATATAVYVLQELGDPGDATAVARGAEWLWRARRPDGSWHVPTRATPVQVFFDNGDPHGTDQFISLLATGWATAALSRQQPATHGTEAGEPASECGCGIAGE